MRNLQQKRYKKFFFHLKVNFNDPWRQSFVKLWRLSFTNKKNWCKTQENTNSRSIQPKLGQGVKRCLQFCANHEGSKKSQKILISSEKIVLFNWKYYLFCLKFIWKKDLSENKLPPQKILIKNKLENDDKVFYLCW